MSQQAQRHQQGTAPQEVMCSSAPLWAVLQRQVLCSTEFPAACSPACPFPQPPQPCKLPELNSAHTSVEGELFARYIVSARRVSYESVFKYVTGSINRDLL